MHEFVRAATALCPPDLAVDVTIDAERRLTGVFAGVLPGSHAAACSRGRRQRQPTGGGRFDVVLTTNGGYPLDRNLYQSVKGMAAAERVVADGGVIVMAAACADGVPDAGAFARLLAAASSAEELRRPEGPGQVDGWQTQVLGRVLGRAEVWLYSEGLSDAAVRTAQLTPVGDVAAAVADALGRLGPGPGSASCPRVP